MSATFDQAVETWQEIHDAWDAVVEAAFLDAERACRGTLLNKRGREQKIDPRSLFYGPQIRAMAYASQELVEHWRQQPRVPFGEFERQALRSREHAVCEHCGTGVA